MRGGYWAALDSSGTNIHLYETWTSIRLVGVEIAIKSGKFEHFEWANEDDSIVTCSSDGLVAVWSRYTGKRMFEYVDKRTHFKTLIGLYNCTLISFSCLVVKFQFHGDVLIFEFFFSQCKLKPLFRQKKMFN